MRNLNLSLSLIALLILATGCPKQGGGGDLPDGGSDAGVEQDAGPPPPPARELADFRIFGEMDLENRVLDPNLQLGGFSWFAMNAEATQMVGTIRQTWADTPSGQPVLAIPKGRTTQSGIVLAGLTRGGKGPLDVSIWLGRPVGGDDLEGLHAAITGYVPSAGRDLTVNLQMDEDSKVIHGDVAWRRWHTRLEEGVMGWGLLIVSDASSARLFASGPAVVQADGTTGLRVGLPKAPVIRELGPVERRLMEHVNKRLGESLSRPGEADDSRRREHLQRSLRALSPRPSAP